MAIALSIYATDTLSVAHSDPAVTIAVVSGAKGRPRLRVLGMRSPEHGHRYDESEMPGSIEAIPT